MLGCSGVGLDLFTCSVSIYDTRKLRCALQSVKRGNRCFSKMNYVQKSNAHNQRNFTIICIRMKRSAYLDYLQKVHIGGRTCSYLLVLIFALVQLCCATKLVSRQYLNCLLVTHMHNTRTRTHKFTLAPTHSRHVQIIMSK